MAKVDDQLRLQNVETWFDSMEMFRQIAPNGSVNKALHVPVDGQDLSAHLFPEDDVLNRIEHSNLGATGATEGACPFVGKQ